MTMSTTMTSESSAKTRELLFIVAEVLAAFVVWWG